MHKVKCCIPEYMVRNIDLEILINYFNIIIKLQEGSDMESKFDELKREAERYEDALRNISVDDKEEKDLNNGLRKYVEDEQRRMESNDTHILSHQSGIKHAGN